MISSDDTNASGGSNTIAIEQGGMHRTISSSSRQHKSSVVKRLCGWKKV